MSELTATVELHSRDDPSDPEDSGNSIRPRAHLSNHRLSIRNRWDLNSTRSRCPPRPCSPGSVHLPMLRFRGKPARRITEMLKSRIGSNSATESNGTRPFVERELHRPEPPNRCSTFRRRPHDRNISASGWRYG